MEGIEHSNKERMGTLGGLQELGNIVRGYHKNQRLKTK